MSKLSADASFGPSKMTFKPCMTWYADGISLEMLLRGLYFFNAQFGICSTHVVCQGDALCGGQDIENTSRVSNAFQGAALFLLEVSYLIEVHVSP